MYKHNKALGSTSVLVPSHVTPGSQGPRLYCLCLQQVAYWANTDHWMLLAEDRVTNSYQIFTACHELCMLSSPTHCGLHKVHLRNYDLHLANRTRHRENEAPVPFLLCHPKFQMTWEGQGMINATTLCTRLSAADCTMQKRLNTPVPHSLTGRTKQNLERYSRHHRDTQGCCPWISPPRVHLKGAAQPALTAQFNIGDENK